MFIAGETFVWAAVNVACGWHTSLEVGASQGDVQLGQSPGRWTRVCENGFHETDIAQLRGTGDQVC